MKKVAFILISLVLVACASDETSSTGVDSGSGGTHSGDGGSVHQTGGSGGGGSLTGGSGGKPATGGSGGGAEAGGSGGMSETGGSGGMSETGGSGGMSEAGGSGGMSETGGSGGKPATGGSGGGAETGGSGGALQVDEKCSEVGAKECFVNDDCPDSTTRCENIGKTVEIPCCVPGPRGTKEVGQDCNNENDCVSALCIDRNSTDKFYCSKRCEKATDCPATMDCGFSMCYKTK